MYYMDQIPFKGRWRFQCFATETPRLLKHGCADIIRDIDDEDEDVPSSEDDLPVHKWKQIRIVLDRLVSANS